MRIIKIHNLIPLLLLIGAALLSVSILIAEATSKDDIVYPAAELGNCKDEAACFAYCDKPENLDACVAFADKHNLLSQEELEKAQKFAAIKTGPGGCNSEKSCFAYCDNVAHIDECLSFGEQNGFLQGQELEEAKKVQAALARGVKLPAGCTNKDACKATCEQPKDVPTAKACFAFAKDAGLLPPEFDEAKTQTMFELIDKGEVNFKEMKKCGGLERGENLDEATINKCLDVGEKLGFMKPEEKEFAKKMMLEGGPDGCRGKACKDVCENNPEKCLQYFEEKGIALPQEAQERMREGLQQMKQALSQAPPEVLECLKAEIGADIFAQIQDGTLPPAKMAGLGPRMGPIMQGCFAKGFGGFPGGPGFGGGATPDGAFASEGDIGIVIFMKASAGIQEFSILPTDGSPYGGGLSTCPKEHKAETPFGGSSFPFEVTITDCEGEQHEYTLDSAGEPQGGGFPGEPGQFPGGGGFPGGPPGIQECVAEVIGSQPTGPPTKEQQAQIEACVRSKFGGEQGGFPGGGEFQGFVPGEEHEGFPGGFEPPEGFEGIPEGFGPPGNFEGFPEGFEPPEGFQIPGGELPEGVTPEQFEEQFQQQYEQQFQEQYQQELQQQLQQFPGGVPPGGFPGGGYPNQQPPSGGFLYQPYPQAQKFNPPSLLGFFAQILLGVR